MIVKHKHRNTILLIHLNHTPSRFSSSSLLFTSRAGTETILHTESTEAGTRPAKSIGEAETDKSVLYNMVT